VVAELEDEFFTLLDEDEPLVSADLASRWPPQVVPLLESFGILERTADATQVACDACDEQHSMEVIRLEHGIYGGCPAEGRIEIDPGRLKCWLINPDAFAQRLSAILNTEPRVIRPGRLWGFGSVSLAGSRRTLFMARGVGALDGAAILQGTYTTRGRAQSVVLATALPNDLPQGEGAPVIFPLREAVRIEGDRLALREAVFAELQPSRPASTVRRIALPRSADWSDVVLALSPESLRVKIWNVSALMTDTVLTLEQAGFVDRRARKPNDLWSLLRELAGGRGMVPMGSERLQKPRVSKLRKALADLIPMGGDPIPFEDGGYRAQFLVRFEGLIKTLARIKHIPWSDVSIRIQDRDRLLLAGRSDQLTLEFEELGLRDRAGSPTPAWNALMQVLERGEVIADQADSGMTGLFGALKSIGYAGEPLDVRPVDSRGFTYKWTPVFKLADDRRGNR
jgi:hypothetical protein